MARIVVDDLVDGEPGGVDDDRRRRRSAAARRAGSCRDGRARRSTPRRRRRRRRSRAPGAAARSRGDAVTYSLSVASGNTTVPMSRPSITPPPCSRAQRAGGPAAPRALPVLAATALTAAVTSRPRISGVASTPSTNTAVVGHAQRHRAGELGDGVLVGDRDAAAQRGAAPPPGTSPRCRGSRGRGAAASARPTVLLPAPAGPSMAIDRSPVGQRSPQSAPWAALARSRRGSARRRRPARRTRRSWPRRRTCTPSARRRRSGRGCPRRPGRCGSRYIRDVLMPSSNSSLRARLERAPRRGGGSSPPGATPCRSSPCTAGRRRRAGCRRPTRRCRRATTRTSRWPRRPPGRGRRRAESASRRRPRRGRRARAASAAHSSDGGELRAADAGHHPRRAHRPRPDADLDDVGPGLDELAGARRP